MKIVLVVSPIWTENTPPYNLALLKAVLENKGHKAICFDLNIELYHYLGGVTERNSWAEEETGSCWYEGNFIKNIIKKYDIFIENFINRILSIDSPLIGFTVFNSSLPFILEIVKKIKKKNRSKIIILGGPECFLQASGENLLKNDGIDGVCTGEGEIALPKLLEAIESNGVIGYCSGFAYRDERGQIIDCGEAEIIEDLDELPFADFSDFDLLKYKKKALPILTSKGCIYRCTFCNETYRMSRFRTRSSESVFEEINYQLKRHPQINEFFFNDSLLNGNIGMLDNLCDLIIQSDIRIIWGGQATIRSELTKELLLKLGKAGCLHLDYGVENGSNKILKLMNKRFTVEIAERIIHDTYEAGIKPNFNIIVGYPGETEVEFQETVEFLKRNKDFPEHVWLNTLAIAPNSDLDRNKDKWGILFSADDTGWRTTDGLNTPKERLRRLKICKDILKDKGFISADRKKEIYLESDVAST